MSTSIDNSLQEKRVHPTTSQLSLANRWDHFVKRLGIARGKNRVEPGLYSMGNPHSKSDVFVTANYSLSFDALRTALINIDCYILVLDTKGINVWCAAGKGTFGTNELVNRIELTKLANVTNRRTLIIPQLGGPGIAAHEVKKLSGFNVEYGPVRAEDLPEYLKTHKATKKMRQVSFNLKDRLTLVSTELIQSLIPMLIVAIPLYFISGPLQAIAIASAFLAGSVLFPILLPWIPTPNFSSKGFILGILVALPFAIIDYLSNPEIIFWQRIGWVIAYLLLLPPITAFVSLNFTGTSTFTSRSGVKREIFNYIPRMAWMAGSGVILSLTIVLINLFSG